MGHAVFEGVEGLLFDLDGVMYVSGRAIDGAAEAVRHVKRLGLKCKFVTNTTTQSLDSLHAKVNAMGLPIERGELVTAASAGVLYLRRLERPICYFVLEEDTRRDYAEFETSEIRPDVVVIGDYGHKWDFSLINRVFRLLMNGADLVALHKGRYFQVSGGLEIDTGAFVTGLEYATGKEAVVIGKPQATFFELALADMGLSAHQALMIGDDILSDVGGAQKAGMRGVLVRTGKYREHVVAASPVRPDAIIDSAADLLHIL